MMQHGASPAFVRTAIATLSLADSLLGPFRVLKCVDDGGCRLPAVVVVVVVVCV